MGLGIIAHIKELAPLSIYITGIALLFMALAGKARWALLFVTFLIPLRNVVERLHGYPFGNKLLTALILAMTLGWIATTLSGRMKLMEKSSLNLISCLLIIYMLISLIIGNNYLHVGLIPDIGSSRTQDWKNFSMLPLLFFITLHVIRDKKWAGRIIVCMCFAMLISAYYTSTQISWFSSLESRAKINGTFQFLGPNEVGAFFNQYTLIFLGIYFYMKKGRNKLLLLGLIIFNFYCMMFLYSRAAYLSTAVGMFFLFSLKNRKLLIPLLLVVIFWQVALPQKAKERIMSTTTEQGELDPSAARRLNIWKVSWDLFSERPLFGIGFGAFRELGYDLRDTHNIYIKILTEQGLVGIALFIILILCFLKEGFVLYLRGPDDLSRGLGLGFMACIIALVINNIFGDRFSYFELSGYLWIFAGLVSRLNLIAQENLEPETAKNKKIPQQITRYARPI